MKHLFRSHGLVIVFSFVTLVAVTAIASSVYLYTKYQATTAQLKKSTSGLDAEIQSLVKYLGSIMELPQEEVPTLATVTDITKLPAIPFFSRAILGDKVLIFQKSAKAILYRPSTKKIIDISVFTAQNSAIQSEKEKNTPILVELRNGTTVTGLTAIVEKKLSQLAPDITVIAKNLAKRKEYRDSIVIARNVSMEQKASELARRLDFAVGPLPVTEASVSADILIIVGADSVDME